LGSGILKILLPPQLLHDKVFDFIRFFSDPFQPGLGFLLWGMPFDDTTVVHDASSGIEAIFAGIRLSDVWRALILSIVRGLLRGLSTISFKVTWFVTIEAFENSPLPRYWG
jgi:hypothetical protein